jgi:hypothetical protein
MIMMRDCVKIFHLLRPVAGAADGKPTPAGREGGYLCTGSKEFAFDTFCNTINVKFYLVILELWYSKLGAVY